MMATLATTLNFTVMSCCVCGVRFGMENEFYEERLGDGKFWYCPSGHCQQFTDTREKKLKRELDRTTRCLQRTQEDLHSTEYARRAAKGQLTKAKKRIANGVCPCCNRSFADLHEHMACKHPDYGVPG